jgi:hypothetical protein
MSNFKRLGNRGAEASAAAFMAFEVARAGDGRAAELVQQAEELAKNLKYVPEVPVLIRRAKQWNAVVQHRAGNNTSASTGSLNK